MYHLARPKFVTLWRIEVNSYVCLERTISACLSDCLCGTDDNPRRELPIDLNFCIGYYFLQLLFMHECGLCRNISSCISNINALKKICY